MAPVIEGHQKHVACYIRCKKDSVSDNSMLTFMSDSNTMAMQMTLELTVGMTGNISKSKKININIDYTSTAMQSTYKEDPCRYFIDYNEFWDNIDDFCDQSGGLTISASIRMKPQQHGSDSIPRPIPSTEAVQTINIPKGTTVPVRNVEGGFWFAQLAEVFMVSKETIKIKWYDQIGDNRYILQTHIEQIITSSIHKNNLDLFQMQKDGRTKGKASDGKRQAWKLTDPRAVTKLKRLYRNAYEE